MWVRPRLHLPQQRVDRLGLRHERRRAHHLLDPGRAVRLGSALGPADQVLEVDDADDVVDVLADHRDAGEAGAQRQGQRLADASCCRSIQTTSVRGTITSRAIVSPSSKTEWIMSRSPCSTTPRCLGQVDQLAQLDLGGERPLAEAAARRDRVADQDQQRGQRPEARRPAAGSAPAVAQRRPVRVLAAERARRRRRPAT